MGVVFLRGKTDIIMTGRLYRNSDRNPSMVQLVDRAERQTLPSGTAGDRRPRSTVEHDGQDKISDPLISDLKIIQR